MTEDEINALKEQIGKVVAERVEQNFVGRSINEVSASVAKSYLDQILTEATYRGEQITALLTWDVSFRGNVMHAIITPKPGLSDEDYRRARRFCNGEEFW